MLADDVRMIQSSYPRRAGAADVGMFIGIYARSAPVRLAPAWLDGREVIAVWEDPQAVKPSYLMWSGRTAGSASSATIVMSATSSMTRSWSWRQTPHLRARGPPRGEPRSALVHRLGLGPVLTTAARLSRLPLMAHLNSRQRTSVACIDKDPQHLADVQFYLMAGGTLCRRSPASVATTLRPWVQQPNVKLVLERPYSMA
jgi:hypothetical protein